MDHDRFTGWDRNVISKNNDITDNGGEDRVSQPSINGPVR